jgi:hypothetical protein
VGLRASVAQQLTQFGARRTPEQLAGGEGAMLEQRAPQLGQLLSLLQLQEEAARGLERLGRGLKEIADIRFRPPGSPTPLPGELPTAIARTTQELTQVEQLINPVGGGSRPTP